MEDEKNSAIERALESVAQDRRKFLGMLLAGIVAAPSLATTALAVAEPLEGWNGAYQHKNKANASAPVKSGGAPFKANASAPVKGSTSAPVKGSTPN